MKRGVAHGESDKYSIKLAKSGVHVNGLHATILHMMGLDHKKLTSRHSIRDYRLTNVGGIVVKGVLA